MGLEDPGLGGEIEEGNKRRRWDNVGCSVSLPELEEAFWLVWLGPTGNEASLPHIKNSHNKQDKSRIIHN